MIVTTGSPALHCLTLLPGSVRQFFDFFCLFGEILYAIAECRKRLNIRIPGMSNRIIEIVQSTSRFVSLIAMPSFESICGVVTAAHSPSSFAHCLSLGDFAIALLQMSGGNLVRRIIFLL